MPLQNISIDNFRAFREKCEFEFAPITILTGTNSSGKSSLTKAILLLQNMVANRSSSKSNLLSELDKLKICDNLNIGNYSFWANEKDNDIRFSFPFYFKDVVREYTIEFSYSKDQTFTEAGVLKQVKIFDPITGDVILIISKEKFNFDIKLLWENILAYNSLREETEKYISSIENIIEAHIPDCNYSEVTFSSANSESTRFNSANIILWFFILQDTSNYPLSEFDKELVVTIDQIANVLRKHDLLSTFSRLKKEWQSIRLDRNVILKFGDICSPGHLNTIYKELPLLIYDFDNKITDTDEQPAEIIALLKDQIERIVGNSYTESELLRFKEIQSNEIDNLNRIFTTKFNERLNNNKIPVSSISSIFETFYGFVDYIITNKTHIHDIITGSFDDPDIDIEEEPPYFADEKYRNNLVEYINQRGFLSSTKKDHISNATILKNIILDSFKLNIEHIVSSLSNIDYIPPFRNPMPHRYYSSSDKGNYLSDLINNIVNMEKYNHNKVKNCISALLKTINIAERIDFEKTDDSSINYVKLFTRDGTKIDLADYGHGISQIIPVLLKIAINATKATSDQDKKSTLIIEEPETNLHPALQSKLADLFAYANKEYGISFIIETHSEYLIRRLQGMIVNKAIDKGKVKIYYFHHPLSIPVGEHQVYAIEIEEDGALSKNFGNGFFDEASTLNIALYNYTKEQHN